MTYKKLSKEDSSKLRNLQDMAKSPAGDRLIDAIHQGTQNTSVFFSGLWIGIHPTKSIAYPSGSLGAISAGTLNQLAALLLAGRVKMLFRERFITFSP